jgi:tRNA A37 threonylcarbamoyltransferase TsaD
VAFKSSSVTVHSQVEIHAPWGGVVPNLASEAHRQAIDGTIQEALRQANLEMGQVDAVAVTIGPGLSLCLKVGTSPCRQCSLPTTVNNTMPSLQPVWDSNHCSHLANDNPILNAQKQSS